jgi:hypothetical protein
MRRQWQCAGRVPISEPGALESAPDVGLLLLRQALGPGGQLLRPQALEQLRLHKIVVDHPRSGQKCLPL